MDYLLQIFNQLHSAEDACSIWIDYGDCFLQDSL